MRVIVLGAARHQRPIRFRDRSYPAVVLSPEQPIAEWISDFDHWIGSSTGYFVGRLVVLNLAGVTLSAAGIAYLIAELAKRTLVSKVGCVSVTPTARKVFEKYAQGLGVRGLKFKSPAAPRPDR